MADDFIAYRFDNGLQLIVEPMPAVRSAAFALLVPAGVAVDPPDGIGTANLLANLVTRGAGSLDSRKLTTALDNLGVQRSESTRILHTAFSAATLARNLPRALELTSWMLQLPRLEAEQLEYCKALAIQEIEAIEDDPTQKLLVELRRNYLPDPLGRPILGEKEVVAAASLEQVKAYHDEAYRPNGAILGVAGAVDPQCLRDQVAAYFADWQPRERPPLVVGAENPRNLHIASDKVQTHIAIAFPSVSSVDDDYFNAHGAAGVLGGGSSARLFTEVREKRGLCYSVGASYQPMKDRGFILCYSSTTNDRAAKTLAVMHEELDRICQGVTEAEVRRVQAGLKSSLIMQEESTSARASVLANNWYNLGRIRTFREVSDAIDRLSPSTIQGYLRRYPPERRTVLTLGPEPLE